ncbi:diaminopimelate decarboxylase [Jatrophihabitans cynanchi]|uniref:Diaminopimelate decarboxylase n=1 Tax=Jatrophihabitans cynanchi TaxID=2944128 RepID=A0ABY7JTZ4_9ACTN|nr:diaminopimelate decarboxylase [Jatrophihabitans sp. SB3-54]WAX55155.1 diaminopimelate decarboxylase [Jatrophihabitans sp. SB3-54]
MTPSPRVLGFLPGGAAIGADGELVLHRRPLTELAGEFGTPCYLVDEDELRAQARRYLTAFRSRRTQSRVVFASKSFPSTPIYRVLAEEGLSCDVAGTGELELALAAGFAPADVYVHGNAKTEAEIRAAVEHGVGTFVIDNGDDIDRLLRWAPAGQHVMLRVIPEITVATHESMVTGQPESKFGLPGVQAREAIARLARSKLDLVGLHCHVGSQVLDLDSFARIPAALARYGEFAAYNFGGGLGVRYADTDDPPTVEAYAETLTQAAGACLPPSAEILVEPGRSLVARAGLTLYTVATVKRTGRTFVAVDGGMADNLEVVLLDLPMQPAIAARPDGGEVCDVVGRHCESGDRLVRGARLDSPRIGDVLVLPMTGAYSHTTASNYNGALRPPIVLSSAAAGARLAVRRETVEDLFARDRPATEEPR